MHLKQTQAESILKLKQSARQQK